MIKIVFIYNFVFFMFKKKKIQMQKNPDNVGFLINAAGPEKLIINFIWLYLDHHPGVKFLIQIYF